MALGSAIILTHELGWQFGKHLLVARGLSPFMLCISLASEVHRSRSSNRNLIFGFLGIGAAFISFFLMQGLLLPDSLRLSVCERLGAAWLMWALAVRSYFVLVVAS